MRLEIPGEGDLFKGGPQPLGAVKTAISHKYSQTQKFELHFLTNFIWVPLLPQTQKQVKFFWSHLENLFAKLLWRYGCGGPSFWTRSGDYM